MLRVAHRVSNTEAEGPGRRYALWVQGCTLRCAGCCNPELFSSTGGELLVVDELARQILATPGIEGISLLGGEPVEQATAVAELGERVRAGGLSVMLYSGYTLDEIGALPDGARLLGACDLLVDGRYERDRPETQRRWIGSANQRLHFLSDRYAPDDARFRTGNTVEIRLRRGELMVNGWPLPRIG